MNDLVQLFEKAISLDNEGKLEEALNTYILGLDKLFVEMKKTSDSTEVLRLRKKFDLYANRAEVIRTELKKIKDREKQLKVIKIDENEVGWDYEKIFELCFQLPFDKVTIEDPYTSSLHQFINFLRFCELLLHKSSQLKQITLITKIDESKSQQQNERILELRFSLKSHSVIFDVEFNSALHDRSVKFSNGFIVILGRGLDIFKPPRFNDAIGKFSIGFYDYRHRQCFETTITIFKNPSIMS